MKILNFQYIKHHRPMYAKYILIVLQCLRFRFEETTLILTQMQGIDKFYHLLFESKVYHDGYDRKVLVISNLVVM